jgi:hypothetical protein
MNDQLSAYLNDHLAGSVVAVDLLSNLETLQPDLAVKGFVDQLRSEIIADQQVLEALMGRLGVTQSRPRQATAWLAAKASALKMRLDSGADQKLAALETLEALALGIEGKLGLWKALAAAAETAPALRGPDYPLLQQRATEQHHQVEARRIAAATSAFGE